MERLYEAVPVKLVYDEYEPLVEFNKPPIIFTHGMLMNRKTLCEVASLLCKRTGRKVYTLDLRGHGSSPTSPTIDIFDLAADVKQFIQDKKLRKVTLVCNSISTRIGAIIANDQPELIEKLVLIEISPYGVETKRLRTVLKYFEQVQIFLRRVNKRKSNLKTAVDKIVSFIDGCGNDVGFREIVKYTLMKDEKGLRFCSDFHTIRDSYIAGNFNLVPLGVCTCPILFVVGSNSATCFRDDDDPLLETYFPNLRKVVVEGGNHMLILEKSKEFVEIVRDFLLE